MNAEKLKKLQAEVRIGGKGTQRRKKKVLHTTAASDDKKLQQSLKKLNLSTIPGIEEVNIIRTDGVVVNIKNPKTQAAASINTFAITGNGMERNMQDMLPSIIPQLAQKDIEQLCKKMQSNDNKKAQKADNENDADDEKQQSGCEIDSDDEDLPTLVADFDSVAMKE